MFEFFVRWIGLVLSILGIFGVGAVFILLVRKYQETDGLKARLDAYTKFMSAFFSMRNELMKVGFVFDTFKDEAEPGRIYKEWGASRVNVRVTIVMYAAGALSGYHLRANMHFPDVRSDSPAMRGLRMKIVERVHRQFLSHHAYVYKDLSTADFSKLTAEFEEAALFYEGRLRKITPEMVEKLDKLKEKLGKESIAVRRELEVRGEYGETLQKTVAVLMTA